jgi:hypothetical protein
VVLLAATAVAVAVVLLLWPRGAATQANFERIQVGMSQADLRGLLGRPEYDFVELGLVQGPEIYALDFGRTADQLRQRGFRAYRRQHWRSLDMTFTVISDPAGGVVCRYSRYGGKGTSPGWLEYLRSWVSRVSRRYF